MPDTTMDLAAARYGDLTLDAVLAARGWRHAKGRDVQRRDVYDADGRLLGSFTAFEAWDYVLADDEAKGTTMTTFTLSDLEPYRDNGLCGEGLDAARALLATLDAQPGAGDPDHAAAHGAMAVAAVRRLPLASVRAMLAEAPPQHAMMTLARLVAAGVPEAEILSYLPMARERAA